MGLFSRGSLFHRRSSLFGRSTYDDGSTTTLGRGGGLWLTAPSIGLFVVSLVLAAAALLERYASVDLPVVTNANAFAVLAIGYLILLVGVLVPRA
jgi:hypothetical protein